MQTQGMEFGNDTDSRLQGGADTREYAQSEYQIDLQAVERQLPDCDWFEMLDDQDDARRVASESGAGRGVKLEF